MDLEKAAIIRRELELDGPTVTLPANFGDPAASSRMMTPPAGPAPATRL
jgi:hypothetical protein